MGLSSALASTAKYSGILSIHKLSRGEKKGKEKSVIAHCLTEEFKERLEKVSVSHGKAETQKTDLVDLLQTSLWGTRSLMRLQN